MRIGFNVFSLALLTVISTWALSGCSQHQQAATTDPDTLQTQSEKGDDHAKHSEIKTADQTGDVHGKHDDHTNDGHHKGHSRGEHGDNEETPLGKVRVGDKVPDFSVRTLDGKSIKLSDLQKDESRTKTGVVVFSFWCSTCHSCRDVEELLAKLSKDYEGQAAVIALDANANESAAAVVAFVKENELDLPIVLDPSGITADLFGVKKTTTSVVIDGDGVLRYCGQFRQKGGGAAEDALKAILAGNEVAIKTTPHNG